MSRIVMTGTTGHVGGGALRALAADGEHELRQIVRDPARAPEEPGVDTVAVSGLDDAATLDGALGAGDRVFLVSAWTGHEERVRLHRAFIDAAVRAEVGHLVYLSFMGAQPQAAFAHARSHAETEADLHACGLPVTILRTSYYGFNLAAFFVDGVVRGPGGAVSWVDRDDCAEALAAALRGAGDPAGATYELTGPAAPTLAQSAARVGELLGTDYAWVEEDAPGPEGTEFQRGIRARGSRAIALGEMAAMGDGVRRLCGREATPVDAYVLANPSEFLP